MTNCSPSLTFYCAILLLYVFCHDGVTYGRAATTKTPGTTTKKNGTVPQSVGKFQSVTRKKIITVKFGGDGTLTSVEQCQCEYFYLCNTANIVLRPENEENCGDNYVCCKLENSAKTNTGSTNPSSNKPNTSFTTNTTENAEDCRCVLADQCERTLDDQVSGAGAIDERMSRCGRLEICCPPKNIINGGTSSTTTGATDIDPSSGKPDVPVDPNQNSGSSTSNNTTNNAISCRCVPANKCRGSPPEDQIDISQIIDVRSDGCTKSQVCCITENIIGLNDDSSDCGMRNTAGQDIFNHSKDTSFGEFPWMALLLLTKVDPTNGRSSDVIIGGASIISPKIVLTAAHRLRDVSDVSLLKVRAGEYDTSVEANGEQKPHQDRQVSKITQHPQFYAKVHLNNLALLELAEPFTLDYHIKPICIPSTSNIYDYDSSNCVATGWGKVAFGPQSQHSTTLKKVDLSIVPNDKCQEELKKTRLGQKFQLHWSFICARGEAGMDTCECDGGGPLVCPLRNNPNRYVQVGIVSWGIGCDNGLPGVYASLERNLDWLTQETKAAGVFSSSTSAEQRNKL